MDTVRRLSFANIAEEQDIPVVLCEGARGASALPGPNDPTGENTSNLVVDWDGPDDPQNPKNWSFKRKWATTAIVSGFTFITPVTSSMIAPASGRLAIEFGIQNNTVIAFITSIYVLGYAFGPLFFGSLSEICGRSRVLHLANLWFLGWNIACSVAQNDSQLLAFRFLSGIGGGAPLAIGGGVIADCWRAEERGMAVSLYALAPILGPALGPVIGAWIAERSTWRWVFWSTSIMDAAILVLSLFFLQETYAPSLLERKAKGIRQTVDAEKASPREVRTVFDEKEDRSWRVIMIKALARPFAFLALEPIIQLLALYSAFVYGLMYLFVTSLPSIFVGVYHQPIGTAGLHYIALGVGMFGASQIYARTLDKMYAHLKAKNGGVGKPEFRLPGMLIGTLVLPIGLLLTGWSVQMHTRWIVPDIGIVLVGAGIILVMQSILSYVIDAFMLYAASATAAVNILRSLAGCGFPLFAPAMYSALGFGKGDTLLAAVAIVFGGPAAWFFWYFGAKIRRASRYAR